MSKSLSLDPLILASSNLFNQFSFFISLTSIHFELNSSCCFAVDSFAHFIINEHFSELNCQANVLGFSLINQSNIPKSFSVILLVLLTLDCSFLGLSLRLSYFPHLKMLMNRAGELILKVMMVGEILEIGKMFNPFAANVPLMEKPSTRFFALVKCVKNTCERVAF